MLYIRNCLIRAAYQAEFYRVTNTEDEPTLPAVLINILQKARMWPPPLPPAKPNYFGVAGLAGNQPGLISGVAYATCFGICCGSASALGTEGAREGIFP